MSASFALIAAVAVSLALSTALVFILTRPLRLILAHLCTGADATQFWVAFTGVMLFLAPLLMTLLWLPTQALIATADVLQGSLRSSVFGALAALLIVGWQISRARPRGSLPA